MRTLLILALALTMLAPAADARKKQGKAGKVTDNVYHDSKYDFDLTLLDDWKYKVGKAKDEVRLRLTQRSYQVPSDYIDAPDYTAVPQLIVYVDTTSFGPHAFIDSLISDEFKSDQKKDIYKEFEILSEPELIPKRRSRLEIGGESALIWRAEAKYTKEIMRSSSSTGGKRVKRSYGGAIAAVKVDENIILFYVRTEWEYFEPIMNEVMAVINSFSLPETDDEG